MRERRNIWWSRNRDLCQWGIKLTLRPGGSSRWLLTILRRMVGVRSSFMCLSDICKSSIVDTVFYNVKERALGSDIRAVLLTSWWLRTRLLFNYSEHYFPICEVGWTYLLHSIIRYYYEPEWSYTCARVRIVPGKKKKKHSVNRDCSIATVKELSCFIWKTIIQLLLSGSVC